MNSDYDERYKRPIPGFSRIQMERDKKTFLFSNETWLYVAVIAGYFVVQVLIRAGNWIAEAWGFAGLLVLIVRALVICAAVAAFAYTQADKCRKLWQQVSLLVVGAAVVVAVFAYSAVPPIRDLFIGPFTGTFCVTEFESFGRYTRNMVAVDTATGAVTKFPQAWFSRGEDALREKVRASQAPVVVITYYPHSKVRTHMEY